MTQQTYTIRASKAFSVLLFTTACGLAACAPEDDDNTGTYQPPNGGLMQDASAVVTGDAGTPTPIVQSTPDAGGTVSTGVDAGPKPVVTADAGPVVTADAGPVVTAEGGAPDGGGDTTRPDQGMGDGKDVITMGDSWMNLMANVGIENSLERVSKRDYRNFGVSGTKLLDEVIPNQYETALKGGPVKTVVMTGGGNDIIQDKVIFQLLSPSCADENFGDECKQQLDKIADRMVKLWAKMAQDGVQDVVVVGYTKTAAPIGVAVSKSSDYSNQKIPALCAAAPAPLRCWTLDTDMAVPNIMLRDGIHPVDADYDKIGAAVWKLMQDKGMRR